MQLYTVGPKTLLVQIRGLQRDCCTSAGVCLFWQQFLIRCVRTDICGDVSLPFNLSDFHMPVSNPRIITTKQNACGGRLLIPPFTHTWYTPSYLRLICQECGESHHLNNYWEYWHVGIWWVLSKIANLILNLNLKVRKIIIVLWKSIKMLLRCTRDPPREQNTRDRYVGGVVGGRGFGVGGAKCIVLLLARGGLTPTPCHSDSVIGCPVLW